MKTKKSINPKGISNIFILAFLLLYITGILSAQDLTKNLTLKDIMSDPPIEGCRPVKARFSPDGKYITFYWKNVDLDSKTHLWISSSAAGNPKILLNNYKDSYSWTGDSKHIIYVSKKNLSKINIATKKIKQLTNSKLFSSKNFHQSHDRQKIAFSSDNGIWMYDLSTGSKKHLSLNAVDWLDWSPDDRYLTFLFKRNLFVVNVQNGKTQKITGYKPRDESEILWADGIFLSEWSPDSRHIAFVLRKREHEHRKIIVPDYLGKYVVSNPARNDFAGDPAPSCRLGIFNIKTGENTWIDHGNKDNIRCSFINIEWSPDGKHILIYKKSEDCKKSYLMLAESGKTYVSILYEESAKTWIEDFFSKFCWTKNRESILFSSMRDGYNHIYLLHLKTGNIRQLTSGKWEVLNHDDMLFRNIFAVQKDGPYIIYVSSEVAPSERHLYRLNYETGEKYKLQTRTGVNMDFILSDDGKKILYTHTDYAKPYDYFVIGSKKSAKPIRITDSISKKFKSIKWIYPEFITFPNIEDGKLVHACLFLPPDPDKSKKYPVIIFLHGGIFIQNVVKGWTYYHKEYMFHHKMVHKGYIVLDLDIRGTSGYGKKFMTDIYLQVGRGKDLSDLVSGIEYLRSLGCVDPDRVGCYGGSGGGFQTLMALCLKPGYFACGVSLRCLTDWRNYDSFFTRPLLGDPKENPKAYEESSPITHAEKLTRPLLLIHGLKDDNSFAQESFKFAEKLIQAGIDFEFMIYPGENHAFVDPDCWVDEYRRIERFMDKHLLDK